MKIFDCFMFYDEEMILDFRLNYLNEYVDKFVVVESSYTHSGKKRELIFDIKKYSKLNKKRYAEKTREPYFAYLADHNQWTLLYANLRFF